MLIMSQDKKHIITTTTLTEFWIDNEYPGYVGKSLVSALTNDFITRIRMVKVGLPMGIYDSEEEAMMVLKEIMHATENGDRVYYMPENKCNT